MTHICIAELCLHWSNKGPKPLSNDDILSVRSKRIYFSEISFKTLNFSLKKMHLKLSAKWRPLLCGSQCVKRITGLCSTFWISMGLYIHLCGNEQWVWIPVTALLSLDAHHCHHKLTRRPITWGNRFVSPGGPGEALHLNQVKLEHPMAFIVSYL